LDEKRRFHWQAVDGVCARVDEMSLRNVHRIIGLSGIPIGFAFAEWGIVDGGISSAGWTLITVFALLVVADVALWAYARRSGKAYLPRD
jgi:hypothetical protein